MAEHLTNPLALLAALLAAAGMGFAIQQGGTCMVAALDQLARRGSAIKLVALAECSLWTSALGLGAAAAGFAFLASPSYPLQLLTVTGGVLLGLGAWLNGACVFGSIAKIGSRDWHYLLTPAGYYLGGLAHFHLLGGFPARQAQAGSTNLAPLLALPVLASLIASFVVWRRAGRGIAALWTYRHATIAIGATFVVLAVLAGPWTYTEALGRITHGAGLPTWHEPALFAALLSGAIVGGRGLASPGILASRQALLCLTGGALMGFGGAMVPGGNDNLILVGLPNLQPHAWAAIAAMALAILAGLKGEAAWRRVRASRAESRAVPA
jgi:toxin CptA